MPKKANQLKTIHELTPKQRKFVDVLVGNWGLMSKTQAAKEAGYNSTTKNGLSEMASKLTNVNKNPHVVRYLEKKLANEEQKYNNKLRSFKRFEKFGDDAAVKHQYAAAINSEYRSGQLYQALLQRALKLYRVTCVPNDFSKQDPVLTLPDPVPVARWHELRALLLHH
jgi:hypothetical protein